MTAPDKLSTAKLVHQEILVTYQEMHYLKKLAEKTRNKELSPHYNRVFQEYVSLCDLARKDAHGLPSVREMADAMQEGQNNAMSDFALMLGTRRHDINKTRVLNKTRSLDEARAFYIPSNDSARSR